MLDRVDLHQPIQDRGDVKLFEDGFDLLHVRRQGPDHERVGAFVGGDGNRAHAGGGDALFAAGAARSPSAPGRAEHLLELFRHLDRIAVLEGEGADLGGNLLVLELGDEFFHQGHAVRRSGDDDAVGRRVRGDGDVLGGVEPDRPRAFGAGRPLADDGRLHLEHLLFEFLNHGVGAHHAGPAGLPPGRNARPGRARPPIIDLEDGFDRLLDLVSVQLLELEDADVHRRPVGRPVDLEQQFGHQGEVILDRADHQSLIAEIGEDADALPARQSLGLFLFLLGSFLFFLATACAGGTFLIRLTAVRGPGLPATSGLLGAGLTSARLTGAGLTGAGLSCLGLIVEHLLQDRGRDRHIQVTHPEHADVAGDLRFHLFELLDDRIEHGLEPFEIRTRADHVDQARLLVVLDLGLAGGEGLRGGLLDGLASLVGARRGIQGLTGLILDDGRSRGGRGGGRRRRCRFDDRCGRGSGLRRGGRLRCGRIRVRGGLRRGLLRHRDARAGGPLQGCQLISQRVQRPGGHVRRRLAVGQRVVVPDLVHHLQWVASPLELRDRLHVQLLAQLGRRRLRDHLHDLARVPTLDLLNHEHDPRRRRVLFQRLQPPLDFLEVLRLAGHDDFIAV